jgi:hypothetical protein
VDNNSFFPDGETDAYNYLGCAFQGCSSLVDVDFVVPALPSTVTSADGYLNCMFYECPSLSSVSNIHIPALPEGIISVQGYLASTFYSCSSLTDISEFVIPALPSSVTAATYIISHTFNDCDGLTDISNFVLPEFPDGLIESNECFAGLFGNCDNIEVTSDFVIPALPDSVTNVVMYMTEFLSGSGIRDISQIVIPALPDSVTTVVAYLDFAFSGCTNLESLAGFVIPPLPDSVTTASAYLMSTFEWCPSLSDVSSLYIPPLPESVTNADNYLSTLFFNNDNMTDISGLTIPALPNSVESAIGYLGQMFTESNNLSNVDGFNIPALPNTVTEASGYLYNMLAGTGGDSGLHGTITVEEGNMCHAVRDVSDMFGNDALIGELVMNMDQFGYFPSLDNPPMIFSDIDFDADNFTDKTLELTEKGLFYDGEYVESGAPLLGGGTYEWQFDGTGELTIDDVTFASTADIAFSTTLIVPLTLVISGTNSFTSFSDGEEDSVGILADGLTIQGDGVLNATASKLKATGIRSVGLQSDTNLIVKGGTVFATGGEAAAYDSMSYGILVFALMQQTGGTLYANGGDATGESSHSYGIFSDGEQAICGGTLVATGGSALTINAETFGVFNASMLFLSGGDITATGGEIEPEVGCYSVGMWMGCLEMLCDNLMEEVEVNTAILEMSGATVAVYCQDYHLFDDFIYWTDADNDGVNPSETPLDGDFDELFLLIAVAPDLSGTPTLSDTTPEYGDVLTVNVSALNVRNIDYVWSANNGDLVNETDEATYTVDAADIGKNIVVTITSPVALGSVVTARYTILPRAVTVNLDGYDFSLSYGDAAPDLSDVEYTISAGNVVEDDDIGASFATSYRRGYDAGSYDVVGMFANSNYRVTFRGNGLIYVQPIAVAVRWSTLTEAQLVYNGAGATADAVTNLGKYFPLEVTVVGDNVNVDDTGFYFTAAFSSGTPNYVLLDTKSVTYRRTPKEVTVVADVITLTYGDAVPTLPDGLSTDYRQFAGVGKYSIYSTFSDKNYTITFDGDGKVTVVPKTIGLTWQLPDNMTFDDTEKTINATATGVVNGDIINITVDGGTATEVGTYTATATALDNDNYQLPKVVTFTYRIVPPEVPTPPVVDLEDDEGDGDVTLSGWAVAGIVYGGTASLSAIGATIVRFIIKKKNAKLPS